MKLFTNKNFIQKIILIFIVIMLLQYAIPTNVSNADWGGVLFLPIQELSLAIGDVGTTALNLFVNGEATGAVLTLDKRDEIEEFLTGNVLGWATSPTYGATILGYKISKIISSKFSDRDFDNQIELPILGVTPDKIFSNKIPLLDVNIINPKTYENGKESSASILQKTIASWYVGLRMLVIVAFLSALVYIGIRIILGSTGQDKAKYKQMLNDWIIGLCLLFFMHYIMSFSLMVVEKVTDLFSDSIEGVVIQADDVDLNDYKIADGSTAEEIVNTFNENGKGKLNWKTDLAGYVRFFSQSNINSLGTSTSFAYTVMYLMLVIYTLLFVFQYLKRLVNIVFLTLVSPIVALAYPLDKIADGKAQAFNTWIKEYIFNLLLQPMHLILYSVLLGSAIDLATSHPIYAIVVLGFLLQAEKLVRKMFGFEKASLTGAASTGAFAGAMVMQGVNALVNRGKAKGKGSGGKGKGGDDSSDSGGRVRMTDNRSADADVNDDELMMQAFGGTDNRQDNQGADRKEEKATPNDGQSDRANPGADAANNTEQDRESLNNIRGQNYLNGKNSELYDEYGNYRPRNGKDMPKKQKDPEREKLKAERRKKLKNGAKKAGRYAKAGVRLYAPKVGKKVAKGAAMAVGAGTLGMVGLAAGLASDDFKNVGSYTAAAMAGGAAVGNIAADRAMKAPNNIKNMVQEKRNEYAKELYKDDPAGYKKYLNEQSDKEFLRSKEVKQQYADEFGAEKANEMMQNALEYRRHGITDNKIIMKAMKDKTGEIGKTGATDSRRIAAAKLASGVQNSEDMEKMTKRLKKMGYNENLINQNEEFIRSMKKMKYN